MNVTLCADAMALVPSSVAEASVSSAPKRQDRRLLLTEKDSSPRSCVTRMFDVSAGGPRSAIPRTADLPILMDWRVSD